MCDVEQDSDVVGKVHHLLFPEAPMEMSLSPSLTTLSMPSPVYGH